MKKTILLLAIILLAGQVFAQIPEDLDARVAWIMNIALDETKGKLNGFERIDISSYERIGNNESVKFNLGINNEGYPFSIRDNKTFADTNTTRRYKGAYLTALEKYGFKFKEMGMDRDISDDIFYRYELSAPSKDIVDIWASVYEIYENNQLIIQVYYNIFRSLEY